MTKLASLALILTLLVCAATLRAAGVVWGEDGHKIVDQHLNPVAKAEIDRLLAIESTTQAHQQIVRDLESSIRDRPV